ncbi:sensor histidine kinase [Hyalangium versicolor]|uniref:sensor histidine kinase n=1 Tax=Hyalangium versicolor TaxID=2861190 RepID=UPI001CCCFE59|nr:ATP-binding protein [Hyalangium versicolor]
MRQRTLALFAVMVVLLYGVDWLALGHASWEMLGVRVIWALSMVLTALGMRRARPLQARLISASYGVVAALCYLGLVAFGGGTRSGYFSFFPALPLIVAMASTETFGAGLTCGIVSALGGGSMMLAAGESLLAAFLWSLVMVVLMFFGMHGGLQFRKVRSAENEALLERSRREALEKLAESERRRAQSEKLATIGRLAASVAHELNNPIAYVRSNLVFLEREVLLAAGGSRAELSEALRDVNAGVERIRQIASDLRNFSHMDETEEPSRCVLAEVVQDAARLASVRLKHVARLQVEVPSELPEVHVVRRRLAQVILNLLVNAGDALEGHSRGDGEIRVLARAEGEFVQLLIEDTGPGFPEEVLSRLFEPFFTTKGPEKGTGIGLMLSREYVEQFGGTLTAANREEGGARLCILLPTRPSSPAQSAPSLRALAGSTAADSQRRTAASRSASGASA